MAKEYLDLIAGLTLVGLIAVAIWLARRVRPLPDGQRYGWAAWNAGCCLLFGLGMLLIGIAGLYGRKIDNSYGLPEIVVLLALGFLNLFASIGLFDRRRYGVVLLILCCIFGLNPIALILNAIYFKKRWHIMGKPSC